MPPIRDLTGQRFGRLTVLKRGDDYIYPNGKTKVMWMCRCDCGKEKDISGSALTQGLTQSCGCYKSEMKRKQLTTHGELARGNDSRLYLSWECMKARCYNPHNDYYHRYGGRGISVCEEWKRSFANFREWALSNGYKEGLTIDRINFDGNYEPSNCRWATSKEQANNKCTSHFVAYNGTTKTLSQWSEATGLSYPTLLGRIKRGWSVGEMLTTPQRNKENTGYVHNNFD